ncbi:hypothetical protein DFH08DRAFT_960471 [Mycena albidolilacea]|uniref:Uncharacterized protein n=1 Tax=Mycena albidolilacea TaxID=1033008 RepID=A0AAD7ETG5_9AGAR|nr:hypothetical protein DFH08DRAFT_960471 [Mycena albidolilacea]
MATTEAYTKYMTGNPSAFISPGYVPAPAACATAPTAICIAHNAPYLAGTPLDAVPAAATSCALACPTTAAPAFPHVSPPLAQPPFVIRTPFADHAITKPKPNSKLSTDADATGQHAAPRTLIARPETELPPAPAAEPVVARAFAHPCADAPGVARAAAAPQTELRKRSGSIVTPLVVRAAAGGKSGLGGYDLFYH